MNESRLYDALARPLTRRDALKRSAVGVAGLTVGGSLLAACGSDSSSSSSSTTASGGGSSTAATSVSQLTEYNSFGGDTFANAISYLAVDQGIFAEEGIDLKTDWIEGTVKAVQSMVGGGSGLAWGDPFGQLTAVAAGFPLKSVFQTWVGGGYGQWVLKGSPITAFTAAQIRGKKVGITEPDGGEVPFIKIAATKAGLKEGTDYEIVVTGSSPPEIADALESGRIDVMGMSVLDVENLRNVGVETTEITPSYLNDFPGHSYFTTPEQVEENEDVLQRFLRARAKGLVWLHANPLGAAAIGIKYAPASAEGLSTKEVAGFLERLWLEGNEMYFEKSNSAYHQIGLQSPERWDEYQKVLIEANVASESGTPLKEPLDVNEIVDNSMVAFANEFDYAEIEKEAKAYGTKYDPKKKKD